MASWQDILEGGQAGFVAELLEFIRIPSVSASTDYAADVVRAGEWVEQRLTKAGAENVALMQTGGHPVVYADWLHAGAGKPTILIYGHFDVQPAEPFDLWDSPPFEPEIRDGRIYGRGASDDKGGMLIPILAVEAMLAARGDLPVNIKFLFEGQEEIGSPELPDFVAKHRDLLACDMIFSADGLQWTADEPNLVVGLKGLVGLEITVTGPDGDQHSGLHGGAIANPLMALSQIVASLKGMDGRIQVAGFYDDVLDLTDEDRAEIARVPYDEAAYIDSLGVPELFGEEGYTTRERLWARPTLDVNGIWGGYQGLGTKTVHPAEASAKITCRLVANQTPDRIFTLIKTHIEASIPQGVRVQVDRLPGNADPFQMPRSHNASQIAKDVLAEVYGMEPYVTRLGGSIPVMSIFQNELGVQTTMFGFSIGDENLHAPNEFFRLRNFKRGQIAYGRLLEKLGE
ncbi:MAG: dipeptidase [Alphaproteobacteria bacterium]|nr:dipeptidase [Alphaproteobacteria bacterium]